MRVLLAIAILACSSKHDPRNEVVVTERPAPVERPAVQEPSQKEIEAEADARSSRRSSPCVMVEADRTVLFWYLPDRLTVHLAGPTEATVGAEVAA